MPSAQQLRAQIEASLAKRIPSALTPMPRTAKPVASTGVDAIDRLSHGGFPLGAITELVGPESSGRTTAALSFVATQTKAGKVCAWVDVSDAFHPESAAALGIDLARLLWIRCGVSSMQPPPLALQVKPSQPQGRAPKAKPGLPQGGGGHPRMESRGMSDAVSELLSTGARAAEPLQLQNPAPQLTDQRTMPAAANSYRHSPRSRSWRRLEQALRVSDLLLQAGGFSCVVLDMGSLQAEYALRVPLATWFRFRASAERLQLHVLLLTQHACTKSSAGLVLHMEPGRVVSGEATLFTGLEQKVSLARQRFPQAAENVLPIRKPPQSTPDVYWQSKAVWSGRG